MTRYRHVGLSIFRGLLGIVLCVCGLLAGGVQVALADPPAPRNVAELDAFLDGVVGAELTANQVPGALVVVVQNGAVLTARGYGLADVSAQRPVDPALTMFRVGSVSKVFVATAVMQLVEQGKLSLDEDVNHYLDFELPATFSEPITLRHLLTHTAGFESRSSGLITFRSEGRVSLGEALRTAIPTRIFRPGTVGAYSNYGAALAGYIVERVSGEPFERYVDRHIFKPLGMEAATFQQPVPPALAIRLAQGYGSSDSGFVAGGFEYVSLSPAGALSITGLDMARFMVAQLQRGRYADATILTQSSAEQMQSLHYKPDARLNGGMAGAFLMQTVSGQRMLMHLGDTALFHSGLFLLPDMGLGLFIATNGGEGARLVDQVEQSFMKRFLQADAQASTLPANSLGDRAALYAGDYYLAPTSTSSFEKVFALLAPITVRVNEDQTVLMGGQGRTRRFVEVQPGVLQNLDRPEEQYGLVQQDGQVLLVPTSPFVMIKADWARSTGLHLLILLTGGLVFFITLCAWLFGWLKDRSRQRPVPLPVRLARWTVGLFGGVFLTFVVLFVAVLMNQDPASGVPLLFLGAGPDWFDALLRLPLILVGLLVSMSGLLAWSWWKRQGSLTARLLLTAHTLLGAAVTWSLFYWNL